MSLKKNQERLAVYIFGIIFIIVILIIALIVPEPKPFPYLVFRTILALASAGVAAFIPGFLNINISNYIRAGGAIAVFVLVMYKNPAALMINKPPVIPYDFTGQVEKANSLFKNKYFVDAQEIYFEILEKLPEQDTLSFRIRNKIGECYYENQELGLARDYFISTLNKQSDKTTYLYSTTLDFIGDVYLAQGNDNLEDALFYFMEAKKLKTQFSESFYKTINKIIITYGKYYELINLEEYIDSAHHYYYIYYEDSLGNEFLRSENLDQKYSMLQYTLGSTYLAEAIPTQDKVKKIDLLNLALDAFEKSTPIFNNEEYRLIFAAIQENIGITHIEIYILTDSTSNKVSALKAFDMANEVFSKDNNSDYAEHLLNMGNVYLTIYKIERNSTNDTALIRKAINIGLKAIKLYNVGSIDYAILKYNIGEAYYYLATFDNKYIDSSKNAFERAIGLFKDEYSSYADEANEHISKLDSLKQLALN